MSKRIIDVEDQTYDMIRLHCVLSCDQREALMNAIEFSKPYEEKSQGEWITVHFDPNELNAPEKSKFDFVKCPFCGIIHQGRHNFCSRCGADMRGDKT